MNAKTTIRKIVFIAVWLCIGGGMLTLLLAAISKKNKGKCNGYAIVLKGDAAHSFIDKKDVESLLKAKIGNSITGQPITGFNLQKIESELKHNSWIDDAEAYFDNKDVLHIAVTVKSPVARIFTTGDNSFYIDSSGRKIPLSDKGSARVPVFTGFPDKKMLTARDSILLEQVRKAANYIINDPFWLAQVSQVDITADRNFEMVPVVGDHLVRMGPGENMDQKFRRLFVFYQQILSKTGFEKYKMIDVQYAGQVVVSRSLSDEKLDTVQLRKNVEKLLRQARESQDDTVASVRPLPIKPVLLDKDPEESQPEPKATTAQPDGPNAMKAVSVSTQNQDLPKKRVPKAVMPPKTNN